ncbi:tRNA-modifying enzyme [Limihaloglobus sulfuriphilus]|uniref:tRNA-modifying enzyme n=1 Tax=Limihaloglobus sulfuriphilus TaxID=1851148 RepID=A0A1Q2MHS4_9BACT|nr:radical SAM protein [Limihaloglobus sulfuriphilus]AQQ71802.1 tRNA-modifying enzyme [Limihaloglobus sulfuriphilus]
MENDTNNKKRNYIFGPVPSRRLGRSLGVDLVPFKTCSYDCVYCQLGRTTNKTTQRKEWVPLTDVIDQLKDHLYLKPDYITLSGSGEPTLFSKLEELILKIKEISDTPVAVLTNGSLLWLPEVRYALNNADMVIPSLDAGSNRVFQYVNRPHPDITFSKMLQGLVDFRSFFRGQYWLEVFLLAGVTTPQAEIVKLKSCIDLIQPDLVQINTVTRPPAEDYAEQVPKNQLEEIAIQLFERAEIIADYRNVHKEEDFTARREDILILLQRRPCSIEDIAAGLGLHRNEVVKYIEELSAEGRIETKRQNQMLYYKALT